MPAAADGSVVFSTELDESGLKSGLSKLSSVGGKWAKGFGVMIGGVSTALLGLAKMGMQYNSQMENYQTNFAVLLGDEAKALDYVALMREKAAKTPFGMEDLASASQTMLSFGMSAEDSMKYMDMLGDISLGNKDKLGSLSLAFSQISSAGKLTGQDLLQMINSGFNPLTTIAEKTGASIGDLKAVMAGDKASDDFVALLAAAEKEVETLGDNASDSAKMLAQIGREGMISADMVAQAMEIETSAGGRFYQGMLKASKTMSGMISTLKDDAMNLVGNVFAPLSAAFAENVIPLASGYLTSLTEAFEQGGTSGLIDELGTVLGDVLVRASEALPGVIDVSTNILSSVFSALTKNAPRMARALSSGLVSVIKGIATSAPQLVEAFASIIPILAESLANPDVVTMIFDGLADSFVTLSANAPQLIDSAIAIFDGLIEGIVLSLPKIGRATLTILENIGSSLVDAAPDILSHAANGIIDIINGVFSTNLPHIEDIEWPTWAEIKQGVINWWTTIKASIATIVDKVLAKFGLPPWADLSADISAWWETTKANIISVIDKILFAFGLPSYDEMALGVSEWWTSTKASIVSFLDDILFSFGLPSWAEIKSDISTQWEQLKEDVKDFFTLPITFEQSEGSEWSIKDESGHQMPYAYYNNENYGKPAQGVLAQWWNDMFGGEESAEDAPLTRFAKADVDKAVSTYENATGTVVSKALQTKALVKAKIAAQEAAKIGIGVATKTAVDSSDESGEYTAYGEEVAGYVADGLAMGAIELADAGRKAMLAYAQSIEAEQSSVQAAGQKAVQGLVSSIEGQQAAVQAAGRSVGQAMASAAAEGVNSGISGVSSSLSSGISEAQSSATSQAQQFRDVGYQISAGMAQGVRNGSGVLINAVTAVIDEALNAARRKAQINSPARLFADKVGVYIPPGIAMGVEESAYVLNNSVQNMIDDSLPDMSNYGGGLGSWQRVQQLAGGGNSVNQTINFNQPIQTPDEVAQAMYEIATFPMAGEVIP